MTLANDYDHDERPGPVIVPANMQQVGFGIVDTPQGQRVALNVITLLDPATAKAVADELGKLAASMSATGLVIAGGTVR